MGCLAALESTLPSAFARVRLRALEFQVFLLVPVPRMNLEFGLANEGELRLASLRLIEQFRLDGGNWASIIVSLSLVSLRLLPSQDSIRSLFVFYKVKVTSRRGLKNPTESQHFLFFYKARTKNVEGV